MMRAAERGLRKNPFKIEISSKTLLLRKIRRAQKKNKKKNKWALQKYYSCAAAGLWKKVWHTAIAASATD